MTRRREQDRSILSSKGEPPPEVRRYGDHPDQVVDVWLPSAPVRGAVWLLHGGFWGQEYDRGHLRSMAWTLHGLGLSVWLPEYRRVRGAGGWPATFEDVSAAPSLLAESDVPVVVVGHSAGGQLALWLAATTPPSRLVGVVALAPVADLVAADRLGLGDGAVAALMRGSSREVPERYTAHDPAQLPTPNCPMRLLHGSDDSLVPASMSRDFARDRPGVGFSELACGHFELVDPNTPAFATVASAITTLLDDASAGRGS